jgi:predicted transcriptional regulator
MFNELDPLLHSQLRLSIISILISVNAADFGQIKALTNATAGNISVQLKKLQDAGYIEVNKSFRNNYQHTSVQITKEGVLAFEKYVEDLKAYLQPGQKK